MRTTVRIDERLLRDAKAFAARNGRTLTGVIDDALRQFLSRRAAARAQRPYRVRTFRGGGLVPGVDLDDSAALLELMEESEPLEQRS